MIILDNFEESCSYTFRTKYFDPILASVHEIFVGIILEERMFLAKERFWNVEWFLCVTLNRGQISPFYRRTKTENEKSYLFKKNGNNGWEGSNVQNKIFFGALPKRDELAKSGVFSGFHNLV